VWEKKIEKNKKNRRMQVLLFFSDAKWMLGRIRIGNGYGV